MAEATHCDVIVVGTGAGGGMLAYELAKAGLNVVSLEQGGRLADDHFKRVDPPGTQLDFGIRSNTVWPAEPHDSLFVHPLFEKGADGSTGWPDNNFHHYQILAVNGLQNLWNGVSVRFSARDFRDWPIPIPTSPPITRRWSGASSSAAPRSNWKNCRTASMCRRSPCAPPM